ncbi:MAG: hypothetical protein PHO66_05125 [Eubacteriales bacterium]|nr:hypothetical protein [Eubacteriales bacterium]
MMSLRWNSAPTKSRLSTRDIALVGILSALLTVGKLSLSFLPNIEVVTLLLMVYTVVLGWQRAILAAVVFSLVEILLYGIQTWVVMYLLIWPALVALTALLQRPLGKLRFGRIGYALVAGLYGFVFGFLCAVVEACFYTGSRGFLPYFALYWVKGLPFDALHAAGNLILNLLLFTPLIKLFQTISAKLRLA